ncbi:MAG: glycosyltransferase [Chloroflexi bacterium]|nr:glycosyltransferase [Chloroflexota bacterium]
MKIALIHDFLFEYAGSERVTEQILRAYPESDLHCLVDYLKPVQRGFIQQKPTRTSFIQKLPLLSRNPARYLPYVVPLLPLAVEQFDLSGYDLVLSSSHTAAKGVLTGPDQLHIAYIHSPMRYAWDLQSTYLNAGGIGKGLRGSLARLMLAYLRGWDARSANGVDVFLANSHFVARRIWKTYRREAAVIYPPVDTEAFPYQEQKEDYYVTVSRLVAYKRVDVIVSAFDSMPQKKLLVIGAGPEYRRLQTLCGPNVTLAGYQQDSNVRKALQKARGFIIAAEEDFGIAPVEAQACGTPVIAYHRGGVAETIQGLDQDQPTGLFFDRQDPQAVVEAVEQFERLAGEIAPAACRANALRFSPHRFIAQFREAVEQEWSLFQTRSLNWAYQSRLR